jgi:SAM-dependent methyltransferase
MLSSIVARMQHLGNVAFDRVAGIETAGLVDRSQLGFEPDTGNPYQPSNWVNLIGFVRMLRALHIGGGDTFLELGCGKGQVLFVAAHFPFGRVVGLDLSEDMIAVARRNMDPTKHRFRCQDVDLVVGDAAELRIADDVNVCYLYNAFPRPVLERVLDNLDVSLAAHPRRMRLFYLELEEPGVIAAHGYREVRRIRRLRQFVRDPGAPLAP